MLDGLLSMLPVPSKFVKLSATDNMISAKIFASLDKSLVGMPDIPDEFRDQFKDLDQHVHLKIAVGNLI